MRDVQWRPTLISPCPTTPTRGCKYAMIDIPAVTRYVNWNLLIPYSVYNFCYFLLPRSHNLMGQQSDMTGERSGPEPTANRPQNMIYLCLMSVMDTTVESLTIYSVGEGRTHVCVQGGMRRWNSYLYNPVRRWSLKDMTTVKHVLISESVDRYQQLLIHHFCRNLSL